MHIPDASVERYNDPLHQNHKTNSFSILGVAYIANHGLVKDTREGKKERQMAS